MFDLQDKVATSVAGIIEPTLRTAEIRRAAERPTSDLTAYDLYLRALQRMYTWESAGYLQALALLSQAIELDPRYGAALAWAALCHLNLHVSGWTNEPDANRREGLDLAHRALRAAGDDPLALGMAAYVLGYYVHTDGRPY